MEEQIIIMIALAGLFGVPLMCGIFCLYIDNMGNYNRMKEMTRQDIDYYDSLPLK
mgnify:FL=1